MTADAFSDLILFLACAWLLRARVSRPLPSSSPPAGVALAVGLIGAAALLGVFRFSSHAGLSEWVRGAHQFASVLAAVGAFPIWAFSLAYPGSPLSQRWAGAWWLTFVVGGFGVAIWAAGFKHWGQAVPALCGMWMAWTVLRRWTGPARVWGLAGLVCLFASFASALLLPAQAAFLGFVTKTQLLHYLLALALVILTLARPALTPSDIVRRGISRACDVDRS